MSLYCRLSSKWGRIPLFIKTPKNIFRHGVSQYDKNSAYTMSFNVSKEKEWMSQNKRIWNEIESQLFENLATEPRKGTNVYHIKLYHAIRITMQRQC